MQLEKIQYTSPKVPELVMQSLINAIEGGQIQVGAELPSERDLAEKLGVGRGSLRECLAIMEFLGAIEGCGNRKRVAKDADYIRKAISFVRISNQHDSLDDFIEFRRVTEVEIVRLACKRATDDDLSAIRQAVERLENDPMDAMADVDFHDALAYASHNTLMAATIHLLNSMIAGVRTRFYMLPDYIPQSLESHRALYEAVAAKNQLLAEQEMNHHLDIIEAFARKYPQN